MLSPREGKQRPICNRQAGPCSVGSHTRKGKPKCSSHQTSAMCSTLCSLPNIHILVRTTTSALGMLQCSGVITTPCHTSKSRTAGGIHTKVSQTETEFSALLLRKLGWRKRQPACDQSQDFYNSPLEEGPSVSTCAMIQQMQE